MTALDLTGARFGRLVVCGRAAQKRRWKVLWHCECDCGGSTVADPSNLRRGHTKSCGCLQREKVGAIRRTHGLSGTSEYRTWLDMIIRCESPANEQWKNYGGRGISVCERWMEFENFIADMGPRPPGLTIERINNDGNYEPSNCKWATMSEQNRNKRNTRKGVVAGFKVVEKRMETV